jgi:hypothetical protein
MAMRSCLASSPSDEKAEPGAVESGESCHTASISVVIVLWYYKGGLCWSFPQASFNDYL